MVLRHGEAHIDRCDLGDDGDAGSAPRTDVVARVHRAQANAAIDGRGDGGITQVELRGLHLGLVGNHRAFELLGQGGLRVQVLARNRILVPQGLVALERHARCIELRLVARQLPLGLLQCLLKRARIDLGQLLALLDHLPLGEQHIAQYA